MARAQPRVAHGAESGPAHAGTVPRSAPPSGSVTRTSSERGGTQVEPFDDRAAISSTSAGSLRETGSATAWRHLAAGRSAPPRPRGAAPSRHARASAGRRAALASGLELQGQRVVDLPSRSGSRSDKPLAGTRARPLGEAHQSSSSTSGSRSSASAAARNGGASRRGEPARVPRPASRIEAPRPSGTSSPGAKLRGVERLQRVADSTCARAAPPRRAPCDRDVEQLADGNGRRAAGVGALVVAGARDDQRRLGQSAVEQHLSSSVARVAVRDVRVGGHEVVRRARSARKGAVVEPEQADDPVGDRPHRTSVQTVSAVSEFARVVANLEPLPPSQRPQTRAARAPGLLIRSSTMSSSNPLQLGALQD